MEQISIKVVNENGKEILDFFNNLGCDISNLWVDTSSGYYYYNDVSDNNKVMINDKPLGITFESLEEAKKFYSMKEEKEIKIEIPEGYEIDKENSTFECIKLKKKKLTYEDISKALFKEKEIFYIDNIGKVSYYFCSEEQCIDSNNCTSKKQAEKLLAINKLMNVAKYLNEGWTPDWNMDTQNKYYFYLTDAAIYVSIVTTMNVGIICFKTQELAEKAIEILGEETIRLALSTDY